MQDCSTGTSVESNDLKHGHFVSKPILNRTRRTKLSLSRSHKHMHSLSLAHSHTHTFKLNAEFHTVYSHRYTLSYLCSVHNFCWAAVPHFLINDLAWALNQTHPHTHKHASQTHTNHKNRSAHGWRRGVTDGDGVKEMPCLSHVWRIYNMFQGCVVQYMGVFG